MKNSFKIPTKAKRNLRVFKKEITDVLALNYRDRKIINEEIDKISVIAELNEDTIGIKKFINDEYHYESIFIIYIELRMIRQFQRLNVLIHNAFPNPIMLIYKYNKEYLITTSFKRINKIEENKTVVTEVNSTNWFKLDKECEFYKSLNLNEIIAFDLKEFYYKFTEIIIFQKLIKLIGFYPKNIKHNYTEDLKKGINDINTLNTKLTKYNKEFASAQMEAEKMTIYTKIINLERRIEEITKKIKEGIKNGKNEWEI